jgi:hypothetical protein
MVITEAQKCEHTFATHINNENVMDISIEIIELFSDESSAI